jgi:hypothetical protein
VSQPTRAEFQRLLASGALFERYAAMRAEIAAIVLEMRDADQSACDTHCALLCKPDDWADRLDDLLQGAD